MDLSSCKFPMTSNPSRQYLWSSRRLGNQRRTKVSSLKEFLFSRYLLKSKDFPEKEGMNPEKEGMNPEKEGMNVFSSMKLR